VFAGHEPTKLSQNPGDRNLTAREHEGKLEGLPRS
jgi:hypothetical protein